MSSDRQEHETPSNEVLAPRTTEPEFGGLPGALFVIISVTITMYYLTFACNPTLGCDLTLPLQDPEGLVAYARHYFLSSFVDTKGWALYFGWYAYCVLAWMILPGRWVKGLPLRTGRRLEYKINGLVAFGACAAYVFVYGPENFTVLYMHWPGLLSAAVVNAFVQAVYVYAASFQGEKLLAEGGNTGNWFIGRELNPRIGLFDIKTFNELRPGLILWGLIDVSCACWQYTHFGYVSDSMWLVILFHVWYTLDSLMHEENIFSQMDITTDGFGFMLSIGDLAWVPFVYSLQARYLAFHPVDLGVLGVLAVLAVQCIGFYIFRVSNLEKNEFRQGNNPKNLQFMTTSSGRKLLTSGWWGRCRHPNYLGDWIMGWAWCLPCGFNTPVPYFYVVYFATLLVHRQMRDDEGCKKKYGSEYVIFVIVLTTTPFGSTVGITMYVFVGVTDLQCKRVPYRIIPYIY